MDPGPSGGVLDERVYSSLPASKNGPPSLGAPPASSASAALEGHASAINVLNNINPQIQHSNIARTGEPPGIDPSPRPTCGTIQTHLENRRLQSPVASPSASSQVTETGPPPFQIASSPGFGTIPPFSLEAQVTPEELVRYLFSTVLKPPSDDPPRGLWD